MNLREKLEVAPQMERLGMDVIEAGFPCISDGDLDRKSTRLNSSHTQKSRMPSSA